MDALEFLKEFNRMCESHPSCTGCPRKEKTCDCLDIHSDSEMKILIATVEQWSKEHARKTRQSVFWEQWPNVRVDNELIVAIDPCVMDSARRDSGCAHENCDDCRREFWMQEVE
mgnify:CR=1 FL=1